MRLTALLGLTLIAIGCEPATNGTTPVVPNNTQPAVSPVKAPDAPATTTEDPTATPPAADNTAVNQRDRDPNAKTPLDQNENKADIAITADIRKQVVNQADFSIDAQNVKIITADGKVTLRGPVKTQAELDAIDTIARDVAGKDNVENQIEVTP